MIPETSMNQASGEPQPSLLQRYSRQLLVPDFSPVDSPMATQRRLDQLKVLVIGAGGLGLPALLYLASAGIGYLGIMDGDRVETSNLHRQVIHAQSQVGLMKVLSAESLLKTLRPNIKVSTHTDFLSPTNALNIIQQYDLVLDCTDNPLLRYLISDVCVELGKTLVSGSGVRSDGQLCILNNNNEGPCYRCFYPKPPSSFQLCSDEGVIGACIGVVGTMMAVEAIKVLTGLYSKNFQPFLSCYTGYSENGGQQLKTFKMRGRRPDCLSCGNSRIYTREYIQQHDYADYCCVPNYDVTHELENVSCSYAKERLEAGHGVLVDVRPELHYRVALLVGSINIPLSSLRQDKLIEVFEQEGPFFFICRRGNDLRLAVQLLREKYGFNTLENNKKAFNVTGGLQNWEGFDKY